MGGFLPVRGFQVQFSMTYTVGWEKHFTFFFLFESGVLVMEKEIRECGVSG